MTTLKPGTKTTLTRDVYGKNIHGITHQHYSSAWYDAGTRVTVESDPAIAIAFPTANPITGEDDPPTVAVLIEGYRVIVPLDALADPAPLTEAEFTERLHAILDGPHGDADNNPSAESKITEYRRLG